MKKSALLIALLVVSVAYSASAQGLKLGVSAAANLAEQPTDLASINTESFFGYRFGATAAINLTKGFGIQPSLLISRKGTNSTVGQSSTELRVSYFEIPVNLDYSFGLADLARVHLQAGPYFAFGMGGSFTTDGTKTDIDFGGTGENDIQPTDFGLNVGAAASFGKLQASLAYGIGLTDISADNAPSTIKNGVFSVGLTYFFLSTGD